MAGASAGRSLEQMATGALATVCFVLIAISIVVGRSLHKIEQLDNKKFGALRNKKYVAPVVQPHHVDMETTSINGLTAFKNELLAKLNIHVARENDPKWLSLKDCMTEGSRWRVDHISIGWVGDDVDFSTFASYSIVTEALNNMG